MKRVALALSLLRVAACDLSIATSSIEIDAGFSLPDGGSECGQNPCLNDGECALTNDGFLCTCQPGYEGDLCELDVNDCDPNPCLNDGICTDGVASYTCACASGFDGVDCSTNIDDCADNPCLNDGTCTDRVNGYQCDCAAGYSGTQCEIDVDDCTPNPCQNEGACVDGVNAFTCFCKEGHSGVTCSDEVVLCTADICQNEGECKDSADGYTCTCKAGYNGANCETDIDDCAPRPCENGADCTDKPNGYTCTCPDGWSGDNCEKQVDPCDPNPCLHDSTCMSAGSDAYVCSCAVGYTGAACEIDVDYCASSPCGNGGTCADGVDDFTCTCATGFSGRTCNSDPPTCPDDDPCNAHGTCEDGIDGYKCKCNAGFYGVFCEVDIDECVTNPCDSDNTIECTDGDNARTCECKDGFTGSDCETNINDCANAPCKHGGQCVDGIESYSCECADGWAGDDCDADISDCAPNPCMNGGTCEDDGPVAYTCTCPFLFDGDQCEVKKCDEAMISGLCGHGMCNTAKNACTCESGWTGDDCKDNIDECTMANPCVHGACTDTPGSFSCGCNPGYTGTLCDECDTNYQDDDQDGSCCLAGTIGPECEMCSTGWERINGVCKKTCESTGLACGDHGTCYDGGAEAVCNCVVTWYGPACDSLDGPCMASSCGGAAAGTCVPTSDDSHTCTCNNNAYSGRDCEIVDECNLAIVNHMTTCSGNGTCVDGNNGYSCQCAAGWSGTACDIKDECHFAGDNACNMHGVCVDGNNTYTCNCETDWLGEHCTNHDDCVGDPCQNNGTCQDRVAGGGVDQDGQDKFTCDCSATDYTGPHCETGLCSANMCQHGSTCVIARPSYTCDCAKTGFTGQYCETDVDECTQTPMLCNTGVCTNVAAGGGYTCQCPDGTFDVNGDGKNCSSVVSLAAGDLNTCAITTAGSLHCWGDNAKGQLATGDNSNPAQRLPKRIGPGSGWQSVSIGQGHICAIRSGHLYCWGNNSFRQAAPAGDAIIETLTEVRPDLTWSAVSAGGTHTCAISAGSLYCWGNTADGQASAAVSGSKIDAPKQIPGDYLTVSAGDNHTCTISTANDLKCFGRDTSGQLGGATQPIPMPAADAWSSVKAGPTHTCATAGTFTYCWGTGMNGELGNSMNNDSSAPVLVSTIANMSMLGTGQNFSCGAVPDASPAVTFQLYCWGTNANDLLLTNNGPAANAPQPVVRNAATKWTAYAVGKTQMCGVDDGLLYCWGSNANGTFGNGATSMAAANTPTLVTTTSESHAVTSNCSPNPCQNGGVCTDAANGFTCDCNGTGYTGATCASENNECTNTTICVQGVCSDLLGNEGYTCTCPDGLVDVDETGTRCAKVETIAAGINHTCVITEDKTLHCWGSNRYGQFGLGEIGTSQYYPEETTQTIRTPLRLKTVAGISGAVSGWNKLVVGEKHTCATLPSGSVEALYCWGDNFVNEVGKSDGSGQTFIAAPILLDDTHVWTALAAGDAHTCGIAGGQLYCWGSNKYAQIGNGAPYIPSGPGDTMPSTESYPFSLDRPVPLPMGETAWVSVAAGTAHTCATTNTETMYCWGANQDVFFGGFQGQIGIGGTSDADVTSPTKVALADPQGFTGVTAEYGHTCGLTSTGTYCWGYNGSGGVGVGDGQFNTPVAAPSLVFGSPVFASMESGIDFNCGLQLVPASNPPAYVAYCWGWGYYDLLLNGGNNVDAPTPLLVTSGSPRQWAHLSISASHVCAVDYSDGYLYCWGDNGYEDDPPVGIGKLGFLPEGDLGPFDIGKVKAAAATHAAASQ